MKKTTWTDRELIIGIGRACAKDIGRIDDNIAELTAEVRRLRTTVLHLERISRLRTMTPPSRSIH